jgi:hypothetical protein
MPPSPAGRCVRAAFTAGLALWASSAPGLAQGAAQAAVPRSRAESGQALLDAQPRQVVEELMDERLVLMRADGSGQGLVEALVLFSQPPDAVWDLLVHRERQKEYRPELTALEVVERGDNALIEEQHLRIAFLSVSYRLRNRFDASARTITFEIDPSYESVVRHVSGYWELYPLEGGRTLARFGTRVNVSNAVPGFLQNGITRKNVPETLENTRQWVDSGGRWRP